jgi:hypothetical protein
MFVCLWVGTANYGVLEMFRRNSTEIRGGMELHGEGILWRYGVARRRNFVEAWSCVEKNSV